MDIELILAIIGVGFALVALAALSAVRQRRLEREKQQTRAAAEHAGGAPLKAFFVAQYRGSKARFFRVYPDEDHFLFVHAGPFVIGIDADTVRGPGPHRTARAALLSAAGLAVGAAAGAAVYFVGGREATGSVLYVTLGIGALLAVGGAVALPAVVWRVARRGAELDALSPDGLRAEAETELSFRAHHDSITGVKFALLDAGGGEVGATVTFRHKPTGNWTIETTTTEDTSDALDEFYDALGDLVAIDERLRDRLDWHTDEED